MFSRITKLKPQESYWMVRAHWKKKGTSNMSNKKYQWGLSRVDESVLDKAEILHCSPNLPSKKLKWQFEATETKERASLEIYSVGGKCL